MTQYLINITTKLSGATYSRGKPNRYSTKQAVVINSSRLAWNGDLTTLISAGIPSPFHWVWRPLQRFVRGKCAYGVSTFCRYPGSCLTSTDRFSIRSIFRPKAVVQPFSGTAFGLILALFPPPGPLLPSRNRANSAHLPHRHTPCRVGCPNRLKTSVASQPNCSNSAR